MDIDGDTQSAFDMEKTNSMRRSGKARKVHTTNHFAFFIKNSLDMPLAFVLCVFLVRDQVIISFYCFLLCTFYRIEFFPIFFTVSSFFTGAEFFPFYSSFLFYSGCHQLTVDATGWIIVRLSRLHK